MSEYLPTLHSLLGAAGLAITLVLFVPLGALVTTRRTWPEIQLVAGWGFTCLVLTVWGVSTTASLAIPVGLLGLIALISLAFPALPQRIGPLNAVPRLLLLSLPLWLVMLPVQPSQIDTWLNLLPNAAYLFDFGMLPADTRPPSHSLLPAAPYNTQFVAFIASVISGSFADTVMALFNVALLCASGLLFARALSEKAESPPWWACAAGLLLAIFLNPGFVPRVSFAPYGETALAVTSLMAVWLATGMIVELVQGVAWPRALFALALVLAAQVNAKQSAIGITISIGVATFVVAMMHPRVPRARAALAVALTLLPALALYLVWRGYVQTHFVAGELKPLPITEWNFALLPQIIVSMLIEIFHKATFFLCTGGTLIAAYISARHSPWSRNALLLGVAAGVILLFNGFLLFTYIAHFPPMIAAQAHSYFRYAAQLSLVVVLGLIVALRPLLVPWVTQLLLRARLLSASPVVLVLVLPVSIAPLLRFDLDVPQPVVRDLAHNAARYIQPHDRLALLVPGDENFSVESMVSGVLTFTPPRRPQLDIRTETKADSATLAALAGAGYHLALVTCTPSGLAGVPPNQAAMLRFAADRWQLLEAWPYPAGMNRHRFSSQLARGPLCALTP